MTGEEILRERRIKKLNMKMSPEILAFKLIDKANISSESAGFDWNK